LITSLTARGPQRPNLKNLSPPKIQIGSTQFFGYGCITKISNFNSTDEKFLLKNTVDNPQNKICNAYSTRDVYAGIPN